MIMIMFMIVKVIIIIIIIINNNYIFIKIEADAAEENVESLLGPYDGFLKYKGCFTTPSTFYKERTDSYNNNNECAKFCSDIGKNIIGTMGMKCYCLDHVPSVNQSDMECSRRCPDSLLRGSLLGFY